MNVRLEDLIRKYTAAFQAAQLNCAESVLSILCEYYGIGEGVYPRIATPFGGGIAGTQNVCGALTGGMMAIGLKLGREIGGDKTPSYEMGKQFLAWAQAKHDAVGCRAITGIDMSDPADQAAFRAPGGGHAVICEPLVGEVCRYLVESLG